MPSGGECFIHRPISPLKTIPVLLLKSGLDNWLYEFLHLVPKSGKTGKDIRSWAVNMLKLSFSMLEEPEHLG